MANSIFAQTYLLQIVFCKLKGLQFKPFKKPDDKCAHIRDNFVRKRFLCKQFFCCPYRKVCLSKRLSHFAQKTCYKHQHKSLPMMMINRASQKMRHRWKRHPSLDVHWHKDLQGPFKTHMTPSDPSGPLRNPFDPSGPTGKFSKSDHISFSSTLVCAQRCTFNAYPKKCHM